jgi:serine/threonine-protein kinase
MRICPECGAKHTDDVAYCSVDGTRLANITEDDVPTAVGTVMGSYRVLQLLGEGGMGQVYLAEHTRLHRQVALKMLRPELAKSADTVRRFFSEARAVNRIQHENIIEITDFVDDSPEETFYIMEALRGQNLGDLLSSDETLSLGEKLTIAIQVASALSATHEAGIIHRDLKPENIFIIQRSGQRHFVKLLDFGVAKLLYAKGRDTMGGQSVDQTAAGVMLGTPAYMSPEQASGKHVDNRTDSYSLGVILFELMTGKLPFSFESVGELMVRQRTETAPRVNSTEGISIPTQLDDLIAACLESEAEARPDTMQSIEETLRAVLATLPASESSPAPPIYAGPPALHPPSAPLNPTTPSEKARVITEDDLLAWELKARHQANLRMGMAAAMVLVIAGGAYYFNQSAPPPQSLTGMATGAPAQGHEAPQDPPSPKLVELQVTSSPSGARATRREDGAPLGVTPFTLKVPHDAPPETWEFTLKGHLQRSEEVDPSRSTQVTVLLEATPKPKAKPKVKPKVKPKAKPRAKPKAKPRAKPRTRTRAKPKPAVKNIPKKPEVPAKKAEDAADLIDPFADM